MRFVWLFLAAFSILIAGCSVAPIASKAPLSSPISNPTPAVTATPVHGTLHGGQQPIQGAEVFMYAVTMSSSGYGQPSTSRMLHGPGTTTSFDSNLNAWYVPTNTNGIFDITAADYQCGYDGSNNPMPEVVYLYSLGGQTGSTASQANSMAGLMAVLGTCTSDNFTSLTGPVQMNEVTTVAAAYALAGFATDATHMSASNTALAAQGVANAALAAGNLVDLGTGAALSTTPLANGGNGAVPAAEINTLAGILSSCINEYDSNYDPGTEPAMACSNLQKWATADGTSGGTQPTDTATAAINIAHNPGIHVSDLFGLVTSTAPFQSVLSSAPNDWTIGITYTDPTSTQLSYPVHLAIDGSGNVWVSNNGGPSISEFDSTGKPVSGSPYINAGLTVPEGIALDNEGNVWVVNGTGSVSELTPSEETWTNYTDANLDTPNYIAIDGSDNVWVVSTGNSIVSVFNASMSSTTSIYDSSQSEGGALSDPLGIAVDSLGNAWVANPYNGYISEWTIGGSPSALMGVGITNGETGSQTLAVDRSNNVWVANYNGTGITEIVSGSSSATPPFTGAGLDAPYAITIDGLGNVWAANLPSGAGSISELNSSGAPVSPDPAGYTGVPVAPAATLLPSPEDIAIDGSGNLWVINSQYTLNDVNYPDSLVEFVGAAAPVVTPLAVGAKYGTLGTRP
jgi:streptogramin lyase